MRTRGLNRLSVLPVLSALVACGGAGAAGQAQAPSPSSNQTSSGTVAAPAGTRLVVLMVVDQLRSDMLDRYDAAFTGGFRRLLDHGRVFDNATHDHALTETSPGHASISTGTYPARHGMVSNQWWETVGGTEGSVFNVVHEDYVEVGDTLSGAGAPDRLERSAFADWLLEQHDGSRVLSVSAKDRSAVLLGGKLAREVFWFSSFQGRFVTSTYYGKGVPDWVDEFNRSALRRYLVEDSVWVSTVPPDLTGLSRPDTAAMEGDGLHTWLPHFRPAPDPTSPPYPGEWLEAIPQLDGATLDLARIGLQELDMGRDDIPDLLAISLSQTDRIGHSYGPFSREQFDNLLRLDRQLGDFLSFLDNELGADNYTLLFSGDHGVLELPEYRMEEGRFGRRLGGSDRRAVEELLGQVVRSVGTTDVAVVAPAIAEALPELDFIERAWPTAELERGGATDSISVLFERSTFPGRRAGVLGRFGVTLQFSEGVLDWTRPLGTTHGSPYYYDRHVPLIIMGSGILAGRSPARVATVDIAPTLAALVGIRTPGDLDGKPIRDDGLPPWSGTTAPSRGRR